MARPDFEPQQIAREIAVEEIVLGDFHGLPIPPELDVIPDTKRVEIPLTGGIAIIVDEGTNPYLGLDGLNNAIKTAGAVGAAKAELDDATKAYDKAKKPLVEDARASVVVRGFDLPDVGQTVSVVTKRTSEVREAQQARFKAELGSRFPLVATDQLHIKYTVVDGTKDNEGNPITDETVLEILWKGLKGKGLTDDQIERVLVSKRVIGITDKDALAEELKAGHVSVATLEPKSSYEVRVDALERSQGSRPSRRSRSSSAS